MSSADAYLKDVFFKCLELCEIFMNGVTKQVVHNGMVINFEIKINFRFFTKWRVCLQVDIVDLQGCS